MPLSKIISGGQTGADQGALYAAKDLNLPTGGWMPKGYRTEEGPRPDIAKLFNMIEHSSSGYSQRTLTNVIAADGTLIFGNYHSPGCMLTRKYCKQQNKPLYIVIWPEETFSYADAQFRYWLQSENLHTLNVAGNREHTNLGIFNATRRFLSLNLKET
jgi:hypothetical protein